MSLQEQERREISTLASSAIDGQLDAAGQARLEALLKNSEAARAYYVRFMGVSAGLAWAARGEMLASDTPASIRRTPRAWRYAGAAAAMIVILLGLWGLLHQPAASEDADLGVATLTNAVNVEWDNAQDFRLVRHNLKPGWLRLRSGLLQVTLHGGASIWLEGPATIRLDSTTAAYFEAGRMVAQTPHDSKGFTVDFPLGKVVDLGTAFGVEIKPGQTTVQVLEGSVAITPKGGEPITYEAGQAIMLDGLGGIQVMYSDMCMYDDGSYGWGYGSFGSPGLRHGPFGGRPLSGWEQLERLRLILNMEDARWEALKLDLFQYIEVQWELRHQGFVPEYNAFSRAAWDLWLGILNSEATDEDLNRRLDAFRAAREDVCLRRDSLEESLKKLLTVKETAMLVALGYLR